MTGSVWQKCLDRLQGEFPPQQFNTWIRPLQAELNGEQLTLLAPNRFVVDWVEQHFFEKIKEIVIESSVGPAPTVRLQIGPSLKSQGPKFLTISKALASKCRLLASRIS